MKTSNTKRFCPLFITTAFTKPRVIDDTVEYIIIKKNTNINTKKKKENKVNLAKEKPWNKLTLSESFCMCAENSCEGLLNEEIPSGPLIGWACGNENTSLQVTQ